MEEETRRSGIDRRKEEIGVDDDKRESGERRVVLSNYDHIIDFIKDILFFKGLTNEQYKELLNVCYQKILPKHCFIFEEGDSSKEIYILTRGKLKVMYHQSTLLNYVDPIGIIGEVGVFTGLPRSTSVITMTESTIMLIRKTELFKLFKNDADLSIRILLNVVYVLGQKIDKYNDIIEELQKKSHNLMF